MAIYQTEIWYKQRLRIRGRLATRMVFGIKYREGRKFGRVIWQCHRIQVCLEPGNTVWTEVIDGKY